MNTTNDLPPILTPDEARKLLRVGRTHFYELVRSGVVPSVRLGKLVRVHRDTLLAWMAGRDGQLVREEASRE